MPHLESVDCVACGCRGAGLVETNVASNDPGVRLAMHRLPAIQVARCKYPRASPWILQGKWIEFKAGGVGNSEDFADGERQLETTDCVTVGGERSKQRR
ncbi:hypothetical protein EJ06DRAFT_287303 [Trichodelitschia bisporula]|uniref:Uncharacterized protein n=1 Tax=Trichodelitschia bisporula TaxID=703511 RepID=A0A6G1I6H7_9PEZI|nr:hypothetical protein EJ06DRAFT_287303 [Trichodelitschia bisporula]